MQNNISSAAQIVTPVDVARAVGIDPNTARRYLKDEGEQAWERTRKKWPVSELPRLMQICESKRQRHHLNKFNHARLLEHSMQ